MKIRTGLILLILILLAISAHAAPVAFTWKQTYGLLEVGASMGVQPGDRYRVIRNGADIGAFVISTANPDNSIGVFEPNSSEAPQLLENDQIALPWEAPVSVVNIPLPAEAQPEPRAEPAASEPAQETTEPEPVPEPEPEEPAKPKKPAMKPFMVGISERVESHTNSPGVDLKYGSNAYLLSTLVITRQATKTTTGIVSFTNKYSLSDSEKLTDVASFALIQKFTKKLGGTASFTHVSKPEHNLSSGFQPGQKSNWVSLGADTVVYKKAKRTAKMDLTFSTNEDFQTGQSMSWRNSYKVQANKKLDYELAWTISYGLNSDARLGIKREVSSNQFQLTCGYKRSKRDKLQFGYGYMANSYKGNHGNDSTVRLSMTRMAPIK